MTKIPEPDELPPEAVTRIDYTPRRGPGCGSCGHRGEVLYFYPRPGGPPGNQMIPCPKCYEPKECSDEVRAALDALKEL